MNFRALAAGLVAGAALTAALTAPADTPSPPPRAPGPSITFERWTLANGLEVIVHQDRSLPLVAVNLWYHVGPANEPAGRSGFAHLFEHLMFEGSRHVGREFDRLLEGAGATNVNGTTSWDRTNYFETVPREHLELVLWIESDRMGFMLDTLTAERLEVQRRVVKNERRQSYEDAPYGPSALALLDTLFPKGHPYHGAIIGSMADLSAATMDDVRAFYSAFYAPSNATLVIAGDFESPEARRLVDKYFGPLPKRPRPKRAARRTPPLRQARRVVVEEPVELGKVSMGWIAPPAYSPEDAPLEVTLTLLAGGKATRLYRELVVEQKVATDVEASMDANELASVATVSALAATGTSADKLEKAIDGVLTKLGRDGPTDRELVRAKKRLRLELLSDLQLLNGPGGESGRAGTLQRLNHYLGDPGKLGEIAARVEAVTAADVKKTVSKLLTPGARVVVVTKPKAKASP